RPTASSPGSTGLGEAETRASEKRDNTGQLALATCARFSLALVPRKLGQVTIRGQVPAPGELPRPTIRLHPHLFAGPVVGAAPVRRPGDRHVLDRTRRVEWRLTGLKHLDDLLHQFAVDVLRADRHRLHALLRERQAAVVALAGPDAAHRRR